MHPEPQPQPQIMRREYRRQKAQDPEQAKRRAVWRERKYASRMKLLSAQGGVRRAPLARQLLPCIDEQQARRRKTWRENQRARRARVWAAAATEDATLAGTAATVVENVAGMAAAPFEVSSGSSHA